MKRSQETVKEGAPSGFESHRYDSDLDPKRKGKQKKVKPESIVRPKGFQSDRFDR
jgi:hypothetical protein